MEHTAGRTRHDYIYIYITEMWWFRTLYLKGYILFSTYQGI
jgi:hypothetical protein